jgi:hypothetical protein
MQATPGTAYFWNLFKKAVALVIARATLCGDFVVDNANVTDLPWDG